MTDKRQKLPPRNKSTLHEAAVLLNAYMEARAHDEGVKYELDAAYYRQLLAQGVCSFFGVMIDAHAPEILSDEQNPRFLARYKRLDE